jgi:hypothetical protein
LAVKTCCSNLAGLGRNLDDDPPTMLLTPNESAVVDFFVWNSASATGDCSAFVIDGHDPLT